jgi:uncharacterized phage-associated protein
MDTAFDKTKFQELILYLAKRSADDPHFGATKLNKLLFFSDFLAYGQLGSPITGATYQKLRWGPAPRQLLPTQREMKRDGIAQVRRASTFTPDKTTALRDPDLSVFTAEEIAIVDEVLCELQSDNATMVSDRSHQFSVGWQVAAEQEEIPYETVFLYGGDIHPAALEYGKQLAVDQGWVDPALVELAC